MGLKKYFLDNETYGADDVNAAFSHLVTSGVSLFDGTKSLISELDEAVSDTVSSGVDTYNEDSCKVVCENGVYSVKPGVCFMPNGMQLEVDSDGYIISVPDVEVCYVYAEYSAAENELSIAVSQTQGGEGSVPLAKINADGTVTDTRQLAYTKAAVSAGQSNIYTTRTYTDKSFIEGELFDTFTIKHGFKYVMAFNENGTCFGTACFESGDTEKQIRLQVSSHIRYLTIKKEGSVISLYEDSFGTNRPAKVVFA